MALPAATVTTAASKPAPLAVPAWDTTGVATNRRVESSSGIGIAPARAAPSCPPGVTTTTACTAPAVAITSRALPAGIVTRSPAPTAVRRLPLASTTVAGPRKYQSSARSANRSPVDTPASSASSNIDASSFAVLASSSSTATDRPACPAHGTSARSTTLWPSGARNLNGSWIVWPYSGGAQ